MNTDDITKGKWILNVFAFLCSVRMNAITAEPGKDFTASPIQLTIPPGGGGKTVCAPILDDNEVEGANETFSMSLHCENENIKTKVTNRVVTVTIVDDDGKSYSLFSNDIVFVFDLFNILTKLVLFLIRA